MEIKCNLLEQIYLSPTDIRQRGMNSKLLRDNPIFHEAVNDMYNRLTLQEDMLLANASEDERHITSKMKAYAYMRCLLGDFILTLDGFITEAEMVKDNKG